MFILYLILFLLVIVSVRRRDTTAVWVSKNDAAVVKGVAILLVFLAHSRCYFEYDPTNLMHAYAWKVAGYIGQLMVVPFLFFSGYGVAVAFSEKGEEYRRQFWRRRILPVAVNFDIAVVVFAAVAAFIGPLSTRKILLSLIAWESVGNSNWYIFTIVVCYAASWMAQALPKKRVEASFVALLLLSLVLAAVKPTYWHSTMMAYGAGMLFSRYKTQIEALLARSYVSALAICVMLFAICFLIRGIALGGWAIGYNALSMSFCGLLVVLMHRFTLRNPFLGWAGSNVFPIYIYQRLPMMLLGSCGLWMPDVTLPVLSFAGTAVITLAYPLFRFW